MLLARPFVVLPLACPHCGANMCIVAFITEAAPVEPILTHIGEPPKPPPITSARGPPGWDEGIEALPNWDAMAQSEPKYQFDQSVDLVGVADTDAQMGRSKQLVLRVLCPTPYSHVPPRLPRKWLPRPYASTR